MTKFYRMFIYDAIPALDIVNTLLQNDELCIHIFKVAISIFHMSPEIKYSKTRNEFRPKMSDEQLSDFVVEKFRMFSSRIICGEQPFAYEIFEKGQVSYISIEHDEVNLSSIPRLFYHEGLRSLTMVSIVELNIDRIHFGLTKVTSSSFSS